MEMSKFFNAQHDQHLHNSGSVNMEIIPHLRVYIISLYTVVVLFFQTFMHLNIVHLLTYMMQIFVDVYQYAVQHVSAHQPSLMVNSEGIILLTIVHKHNPHFINIPQKL